MTEKYNYTTFDSYLDKIGADIKQTKTDWEVHRFCARGKLCIIYKNKHGELKGSGKLAEEVYRGFLQKRLLNVQVKKRPTNLIGQFKDKLLARDGNRCFYSNVEMVDDEITVEHLIPISKGGYNNMDNVVLCTDEQNKLMGDKCLMDKLKHRDFCFNKELEKALALIQKIGKLTCEVKEVEKVEILAEVQKDEVVQSNNDITFLLKYNDGFIYSVTDSNCRSGTITSISHPKATINIEYLNKAKNSYRILSFEHINDSMYNVTCKNLAEQVKIICLKININNKMVK